MGKILTAIIEIIIVYYIKEYITKIQQSVILK